MITSDVTSDVFPFQHISRLVLVLHPGNEGYRLLILSSNGALDGGGGNAETELLKFPYEEDYLLNCIDAQARTQYQLGNVFNILSHPVAPSRSK